MNTSVATLRKVAGKIPESPADYAGIRSSICGFGIEDFLFVAALGMVTCASYPAVFQKRLSGAEGRQSLFNCLPPLVSASIALAFVLLSSIPIISGTWFAHSSPLLTDFS